MNATRPHDLEILVAAIAKQPAAQRSLIAIIGAPGSGKSTLAEKLEGRLDGIALGSAAVLPMDGYHFDDGVLTARGLKARKGSPETFDVGGLFHMLGRLRRNEEDEIAVPVFDRALEISRAGARLIPRTVRHLIVEGNYLLLDAQPWARLHALFDITAAVAVSEAALRQRLTDRWRGYGLPPEEIDRKIETNDLPNGRFVMSHSVPADFVVKND